MKFEISQEMLQAIANYLMEKPYKEVANLLVGIQSCKQVEEKKPEQEVKDGKVDDSKEKKAA